MESLKQFLKSWCELYHKKGADTMAKSRKRVSIREMVVYVADVRGFNDAYIVRYNSSISHDENLAIARRLVKSYPQVDHITTIGFLYVL